MNIERVRILTTLKAGSKIYPKGLVYEKTKTEQIPSELIAEVMKKTGTVEVLAKLVPPPVTSDIPPDSKPEDIPQLKAEESLSSQIKAEEPSQIKTEPEEQEPANTKDIPILSEQGKRIGRPPGRGNKITPKDSATS